MVKLLMALGVMAFLCGTAHAATLNVTLVTNTQKDQGLAALYTSACNDRIANALPALGGCTTGGSPVRCTCTPSQPQLEGALSVFLDSQLVNAYQNMIDKQAKEIKDKYPTLTAEQQATLRAACPTCVF